MGFTVEEVVLVSLFVQSVTYGFFASLFVQSTTVILSRSKRHAETRRVNTRLLAVSILMFVLSTVYTGIGLYIFLRTFRFAESDGAESDRLVSAQLGDWNLTYFLVGKAGALGLQIIVGDAFMIYRTYMVWGGYIPVCIPAILTLAASAAFGIAFIFSSHSTLWVIGLLWLTLFTNGYATTLIAGRIIWLRRKIDNLYESGGNRRSSFGPTLTIIVESGAIYSFSLVGAIALFHQYGFSDRNYALKAMPQVVGIIFSFIIVRVASGTTIETAAQSNSHRQRTALTDMFHSSHQT